MLKENDPARRRAAGSELIKIDDQHSTSNCRRIQDLFVASRKPDWVSKAQPFWLIGTRELTYRGGATTRLDVFVSLCSECGAPFFFTEPAGRRGKWPNRRCDLHQRPGAAMREFTPRWTVERGGS